MRRFVIFSEFYYPKQISTGYFITQIAERLALKSEVIVISPSESFEEITEKHNGVQIHRIPGTNMDKNSLPQRFYSFLKITLSFFRVSKGILKANDTVICLTNPAFSLLGISILKKKIGFYFVILVHDVFPENLIGSKILPFKGLIYHVFLHLFNNAYAKADKIIVIGRDMKDIFKRKLKNYKGEINEIPNWGDSETIFPSPFNGRKILDSLNIRNSLTFQFSGNIGRAQGIKNIIRAADQLKNVEVKFLFFGDGALKKYVVKRSKGNDKIVYGGTYSREFANAYLNACHIAVISLLPGMKGLGVPSKTYDIMAAGKPILFIGPEDSEIGYLVNEEKIGFVVSSQSVRDIVETIKHISQMEYESIEGIGKIARRVLEKKYSKELILTEYERILFSGS